MSKHYKFICLLLVAALLLSGCLPAVDQLYRLPKRSEEYTQLQTVIDEAMSAMTYCAPLSGKNQQAVQVADLNGDGTNEYLVFAKDDTQSPLRILIFGQNGDSYQLAQTLECSGDSFHMTEYAQMDEKPGVELVFGSQLTQDLSRNVNVYSFTENLDAMILLDTSYSEFLTVDLDLNVQSELFLLRSGTGNDEQGIAELYSIESGNMQRTNKMTMSGSTDKIKRILVGNLEGGTPAVYVASTVDDTALITDVYVCISGKLENVTFSGESGASVRTMRSGYVYAEDIDHDGVVELPYLLPMMPMDNVVDPGMQELIRWYAMTADGEEVIKTYTFHNFKDGWYLNLNTLWASRLTVIDRDGVYEFYIWNEDFETAEKVLTIQKTGVQGRSELTDEQIILQARDGVTLSAYLESCALGYQLTKDNLTDSFHTIRQD